MRTVNQPGNDVGTQRKHIQAVVFDYGGVLAEVISPADGMSAMSVEIRNVLPATRMDLDEIKADLDIGWKAYSGWKRAQSRTLDPQEISQSGFWEFVACDWSVPDRAALLANVVPLTKRLELTVIQRPAHPEAQSILRVLREAGIRLGLASNCLSGAAAREQLEEDGLLELFDVAVFSNEIGWRKPGPSLLRHALTALDVSAERACFVGDRIDRDILGARRASFGLCVLKIADTGQGTSLRGVSADFSIENLSELPGRIIQVE